MEDNIGKEFLEKTKFRNLTNSGQIRGIRAPSIEIPMDNNQKVINLPNPHNAPMHPLSVTDAIRNRRSVRSYTSQSLTLEELSYLLWTTQGVKEIYPDSVTLRTVPSAGARHALETYLQINNVQDLKNGLYRFLALKHKLLELPQTPDTLDRIVTGCLGQAFIKKSAVVFLWTAVPERMTWRYSERGYRYLFLDVGHVCQNLYLGAESIKCGMCAIAAFLDDDLNHLLGIDGEKQFVIYLAALGKK